MREMDWIVGMDGWRKERGEVKGRRGRWMCQLASSDRLRKSMTFAGFVIGAVGEAALRKGERRLMDQWMEGWMDGHVREDALGRCILGEHGRVPGPWHGSGREREIVLFQRFMMLVWKGKL
jgi:hypothetical protein